MLAREFDMCFYIVNKIEKQDWKGQRSGLNLFRHRTKGMLLVMDLTRKLKTVKSLKSLIKFETILKISLLWQRSWLTFGRTLLISKQRPDIDIKWSLKLVIVNYRAAETYISTPFFSETYCSHLVSKDLKNKRGSWRGFWGGSDDKLLRLAGLPRLVNVGFVIPAKRTLFSCFCCCKILS